MTFSYQNTGVKCEGDRGGYNCLLEIENGFLSFQKMGLVAGATGGLVRLAAEAHARKTNEIIRIPLSAITAVEPKSGLMTHQVTVRAVGFPAYVFSFSKRDMKKFLALMPENGSYQPEPPVAVSSQAELPTRPMVAPEPKYRSVTLQVTAGAQAGTSFRLQEGQTMILGRDPARCDVPLGQYGTVSGRHCCLELRETGLTVTDLGSTNGTWVNGVRLIPNHPTSVPDGSELWLAGRNCTFRVTFD